MEAKGKRDEAIRPSERNRSEEGTAHREGEGDGPTREREEREEETLQMTFSPSRFLSEHVVSQQSPSFPWPRTPRAVTGAGAERSGGRGIFPPLASLS